MTLTQETPAEKQLREVRAFLHGGPQERVFVRLDPSSYAAIFNGKPGGNPSPEDELAFHRAFPNDTMMWSATRFEDISELNWKRKKLREEANGDVCWEETIATPKAEYRRVYCDHPGTTPWLVEPAIRSIGDFDLLDYYADAVRDNADGLAATIADYVPRCHENGFLAASVILTAFEAFWIIDYPDMPLFFLDYRERYLATISRIQAACLALMRACARVGVEVFYCGSAGCELLSPTIFREAIVPFQREFNDEVAAVGGVSSYHICGHSRQLIEQKIIDAIRPTIFETCSQSPCGNNAGLREAVWGISEEIITKGNLSLETLRNSRPDEIVTEVKAINEAVKGRRHIIGQADATILTGTPYENIRVFVETAQSLTHTAPAAPGWTVHKEDSL